MSSLYTFGFGAVAILGMLALYQLGQRVLAPAHALARDLQTASASGETAERPRNLARSLLHVGNVLAIFLIGAAIVAGGVRGVSFRHDALWVAAFALAGLALFALSAWLGLRLVLGAQLTAELDRDNAAAGVAAGAHAVATGIIVARAVAGNSLHDLGVSLVFFALAQLSLHALVLMFRVLTAYDDREEIIGENLAAALSYAGVTVAVAIIVGRAVAGDFAGWLPSLKGYAAALGYGLLIYPVRQIVVQGLLLGSRPSLRGGKLDVAIARERNVGMGALEAVAYIAAALAVARVA